MEESKTIECIALDVQKEFQMGGLADGIYLDFASEVAKRYASIAVSKEREKKIDENTSDGYHTFKELYEFRLLYNAALFNEWAKQGLYDVHKSQRHNDGELCFGRNDYFVVVATLPTGQISNHYPMTNWDLFQCEEVEKAKAQWDGHTTKDVVERLINLINTK